MVVADDSKSEGVTRTASYSEFRRLNFEDDTPMELLERLVRLVEDTTDAEK